VVIAPGEQQIPCGNDSKKSKGNSRFPAGMTARKAKAGAVSPPAVQDGKDDEA
jgi:hypothetical protein